jgi:hypothetical protein
MLSLVLFLGTVSAGFINVFLFINFVMIGLNLIMVIHLMRDL